MKKVIIFIVLLVLAAAVYVNFFYFAKLDIDGEKVKSVYIDENEIYQADSVKNFVKNFNGLKLTKTNAPVGLQTMSITFAGEINTVLYSYGIYGNILMDDETGNKYLLQDDELLKKLVTGTGCKAYEGCTD